MLAVRQLDSKNCGPALIVKLWDSEDLTAHASGNTGGTWLQGWQTAASEWPVLSPKYPHRPKYPAYLILSSSSPTMEIWKPLDHDFSPIPCISSFPLLLFSTGIENNKQFLTYLKFVIMSFPGFLSLWKIPHDAVLPETWGVSNSGLHSFCFYS